MWNGWVFGYGTASEKDLLCSVLFEHTVDSKEQWFPVLSKATRCYTYFLLFGHLGAVGGRDYMIGKDSHNTFESPSLIANQYCKTSWANHMAIFWSSSAHQPVRRSESSAKPRAASLRFSGCRPPCSWIIPRSARSWDTSLDKCDEFSSIGREDRSIGGRMRVHARSFLGGIDARPEAACHKFNPHTLATILQQ